MLETVQKFAREQVAPRVRDMDEAETMDPEIVQMLFDQGLMGIEIPEEYGGAGMNFTTAIIGIEELARVDPSVSVMCDVHNTLVNNLILLQGSEELKKKFLPRLASDTVGSFCLSEPVSGSDAFALQTKAVKTENGYKLNGSKMWITNAMEAGIYIVFANLDPSKGHRGITAFVVEKGMPGFSIAKKEKKLGIRASSTCVLNFDDVEIPKENLLGQEGQGYKYAIGTLNEGRIGIAAQMTGLALGAWENAAKYASLHPPTSYLLTPEPRSTKPTQHANFLFFSPTATSGTTASNSANTSATSKACNIKSHKHTLTSQLHAPSSTTPPAKRRPGRTSSKTLLWRNCMHHR